MNQVVITRSTRQIIVAVAAVLVLAGAVFTATRGSAEGVAVESELPATSFELFDGTEATFADFEGEPLVINFWASWCPACVAELPEFQKVHEAYADRVTFLGMANSDRRRAAVALAEETRLTYTLADDPRGELFTDLELIAMPSTIFVDPDGRIHETFGGQLNERLLVERIESLLEAS